LRWCGAIDRQTVLANLLSGQYERALKIVAISRLGSPLIGFSVTYWLAFRYITCRRVVVLTVVANWPPVAGTAG
jgi:hypothetical protein